MQDLGSRSVGSLLTFWFNTAATLTTPTLTIYKTGTTSSKTGTVSVDWNSKTGLNEVSIDLSADETFYAANLDFVVVLTAGTVSGVAVANTIVANWNTFQAASADTANINTILGVLRAMWRRFGA